jgi:hypothetical protein
LEDDKVVFDAQVADTAIETDGLSSLGVKVTDLISIIRDIYTLHDVDIRILAASHGREEVYYGFATAERELTVLRDATDADDNHTQDKLTFTIGEQDVVVRLDDTVVLDE